MNDDGAEAIAGCLMRLIVFAIWIPLAFLAQWAWNEAMPHIFGLPMIDYWQALALGFLSHMLVPSNTYLVRR